MTLPPTPANPPDPAQEIAEGAAPVNEDRCINCGRPRSEHCTFEPLPPVPTGCVCDRMSWGNPASVPPICNTYSPDDADGYCVNCEHDKECHK